MDGPDAGPSSDASFRGGRNQRLSGLTRALLAPAFGAAIALSFTLGWLALDRAFTPRTMTAAAYFALAGTLSAGAALVAMRLLARRPWSARMAAALVCLVAGTAGLASVFMMLELVLTFHDLSEVPIPIAIVILGYTSAGALHSVLAIAAPLILPLGLPMIALFAILIAKNPR